MLRTRAWGEQMSAVGMVHVVNIVRRQAEVLEYFFGMPSPLT